jgi:hypothetical protein
MIIFYRAHGLYDNIFNYKPTPFGREKKLNFSPQQRHQLDDISIVINLCEYNIYIKSYYIEKCSICQAKMM